MDNEVMGLLEMLYTMVSEAWGVPLGNDKCIVEREKVLGILEEIKAQMPVELSEAKRLVSARDEFIGNAKREAESIRRAAEEKARVMIDEQEIVRVSKAKATELMTTAESKSSELRRVANAYVDDALRRTEEAVSAALSEIHESRARFRGAAGAAAQQPQQQTASANKPPVQPQQPPQYQAAPQQSAGGPRIETMSADELEP